MNSKLFEYITQFLSSFRFSAVGIGSFSKSEKFLLGSSWGLFPSFNQMVRLKTLDNVSLKKITIFLLPQVGQGN